MLRAVGFHHYVVKPFIHFHLACFRLRGFWFIALPFVGFPLLHLVFLSCFSIFSSTPWLLWQSWVRHKLHAYNLPIVAWPKDSLTNITGFLPHVLDDSLRLHSKWWVMLDAAPRLWPTLVMFLYACDSVVGSTLFSVHGGQFHALLVDK